jgi:ATP-dependent Lhr-like helicase
LTARKCARAPAAGAAGALVGLPTTGTLLAETFKSRQGWHLFLYPFAGRMANLGLANLIAWRVSRVQPLSVSIAVNDYGSNCSALPGGLGDALPQALSTEHLLEDVLASLNAGKWRCGAFAKLPRSPGWCLAAIRRRRKAPGRSRPPAGCSTRCFANMTRQPAAGPGAG